ncbi:MAG: sulfotransferase [Chthoniobacterales bacterium]
MPVPPESNPPPAAFVVGVPRSGTTLLRMMLDSHPDMAMGPESHFYFEMLKLAPDTPAKFLDFLTHFFAWPDFGIRAEELEQELAALEPFTLTSGLRTFYALYARRFGKSRWGEKTPDYGTIMPEIQKLLPEARFIHIIRDGRDIALSRRHLWFGPGESIFAQAEDWIQWIRRARQAAPSLTHYLEVQYEQLLLNPAEVLEKICAFLELPFREEMLLYHESAAEKLSVLKGWPELNLTGEQLQSVLRNTTLPPQLDRAARWKREMTPAEAADFEEIAGPLLKELGYETSLLLSGVSAAPPAQSSTKRSQTHTVSALLLTDGITVESRAWFHRVRAQVDELVIWIDTQKASAETEEHARALGARIEYFAADGICDHHLSRAMESCRGDWILRLDSDEELSPEWDQGNWRELLSYDYASFALPRYWLTPAGKYLAAAPWVPDFQIRLYRNSPSQILFPGGVHGTMEINGRRGFCRSLALYHHVLRINSRAQREAKIRFYQNFAGPDLGYFYLFEEHHLPEHALPPSSKVDPKSEIIRMGLMYPEEAKSVSLEILEAPTLVAPAELFWPRVQVWNRGERPLRSGPPYPVYLSYHWLEAQSRRSLDFNGQRTHLFPSVEPQASQIFSMFAVAPATPGDYLLQITIVQELVRWFEDVNPEIVRETLVRVRPTDTATSLSATIAQTDPAPP